MYVKREKGNTRRIKKANKVLKKSKNTGKAFKGRGTDKESRQAGAQQ